MRRDGEDGRGKEERERERERVAAELATRRKKRRRKRRSEEREAAREDTSARRESERTAREVGRLSVVVGERYEAEATSAPATFWEYVLPKSGRAGRRGLRQARDDRAREMHLRVELMSPEVSLA